MINSKKLIQKIDNELSNIDFTNPKNQRVLNTVVIALAFVLSATPAYASAGNPFDKIGFKFLNFARQAGYWVCLIKAVMVIIKAAMEEDIFACWKKVLGYLIAFASLYFLPQLFDAVKF